MANQQDSLTFVVSVSAGKSGDAGRLELGLALAKSTG
jgi:hypothetical protein